MAQDFSRYTRDGISEVKTYPHEIIYDDIFPDSKIKQGDSSYKQWAPEGKFFNYKGAGVGGGITVKGCSTSIVDDPVKDVEEAFNENRLGKIWLWYNDKFKSRLEQSGIEIVNMTSWSKNDICGHILEHKERATEWLILRMEAHDEISGEMLCPSLLSRERYQELKRDTDEHIFIANYHQKPVDIKGVLYKVLKTYTELPSHFERIISYTDTADEANGDSQRIDP
ncbi:hypothetical protein V7166_21225 [Bacillus thuringiensis]